MAHLVTLPLVCNRTIFNEVLFCGIKSLNGNLHFSCGKWDEHPSSAKNPSSSAKAI